MPTKPSLSSQKVIITLTNPKGAVAKKHARVLKKMSANIGKKGRNSISQAARDAGYSESYVRSGRLQKTKAWQQLIDQELPDEELMAVNRELLNNPDWRARQAGLHFAYRIKKKYDRDLNIKHELAYRSDEDIDAEIAEIVGEALELVANDPNAS
jgi:hypothetical protein